MSDRSAIEWTDSTWNPIRARLLYKVGDKAKGSIGWHCEHVSPGCEVCYAERFNQRLGTGLPFKPGHRKDIEIFLDDNMLTLPLRWKKPRKIFVGSMTDLFADFVTDEMLDKIFAVMALTPQHTFQLLTKRAARMREYLARTETPFHRVHQAAAAVVDGYKTWGWCRNAAMAATPYNLYLQAPWPLPNVWLGVSCENQEQADARIPLLLQTPAAVRFISAEPLLGPIDLSKIIGESSMPHEFPNGEPALANLDWLIAGGESGPSARPMHPDWVRDLRDECAMAGVYFFFKQWGEWAPGESADKGVTRAERTADWFNNRWTFGTVTPRVSAETHYLDAPDLYRLGKKAAGRLLDGVEHNAFPTGSAA